MNEQVMEKILQWAQSVEEFAIEQAPQFTRELLAWGFWVNVAMILGIVTTWAVIALLIWRKYASWKAAWDEDEDWASGVAILGGLFGALFVLFTLVEGLEAIAAIIKIVVAPRLYLIDYITGALR